MKSCAEELAGIFTLIFRKSLQLCSVPRLWKDSIIVPVPKIRAPKTLNDFRPVALTSLVMKSFERIIKAEILSATQSRLDPLQFAYRAGRSVEDAVNTLLSLVLGHLEGAQNFARLLFIDFSSAFNCIQPHILADHLTNSYNLDRGLVSWIVDFLTDRPQRVKVNGFLSDVLLSSTGSPQGCVLSPLLFILYTNDCRSQHPDRHILKFADDSVIVSLLNNQDCTHGPVVNDFSAWCESSFLKINVLKTKELIVDFRKKPPPYPPVFIHGQAVDTVQQYKYLGTIIDSNLSFEANTDAICTKAHQRMYFYRKLRSFKVDTTFMKIFYSCFIESILTFSFICWFGSLTAKDKNRLSSIVRMCGRIAGTSLEELSVLYRARATRKAKMILSDPVHPLASHYRLLPSGRRYMVPRLRTNRFKNTFVPTTIGFINQSL